VREGGEGRRKVEVREEGVRGGREEVKANLYFFFFWSHKIPKSRIYCLF
jgi:hypothetical protein